MTQRCKCSKKLRNHQIKQQTVPFVQRTIWLSTRAFESHEPGMGFTPIKSSQQISQSSLPLFIMVSYSFGITLLSEDLLLLRLSFFFCFNIFIRHFFLQVLKNYSIVFKFVNFKWKIIENHLNFMIVSIKLPLYFNFIKNHSYILLFTLNHYFLFFCQF